jgi:AraC family transcriptional activator of pobA
LDFSIEAGVMAKRVETLPRFALYGETPKPEPEPEALHIEEVQSRSRLYRWEILPHLHQGLHQALWLYDGEAETLIDERREAVTGPAVILLPPGVAHGFRFAPETDGLVLSLSARFAFEPGPEGAGEAVRRVFGSAAIVRFSLADPHVRGLDVLFRELSREFGASSVARSPVALALARALLWRLAEARGGDPDARAHKTQALYSRYLMLIERHFLEHWPLTRYAEALGLSPQRLNRLTHAEVGSPALEIVHQRLTREACRRLFYIAAPAEKLALELGFEDPAYFSRFFKRRTGLSPRRWRETHRAAHRAAP